MAEETQDREAERAAQWLIDSLRLLDQRIIEGQIDAFHTEGNPLRAWEVWKNCREADLPVPEPVLKYIDRVAAALLALSDRPPDRVGPAVQKALGFQSKDGRGSDLSRFREGNRDVDLAIDVRGVLDGASEKGHRLSQEEAFARVAERRCVSEEVVRRAWRKHAH